jgi:hypothetical protein
MEYFEAFDGGHVVDFHGYRVAREVKRGRPRGCRQTEEAKARISAATSGPGNPMFGKEQSRRTRLLQSQAAKRHWQLRREVIARMEAREAARRSRGQVGVLGLNQDPVTA